MSGGSLFRAEYLGLVSYIEGLKKQAEELSCLEQDGLQASVLGLEHHSVVTLGIRAQEEVDLTLSRAEIQKKGYEIFQTNRGGQATLHQPGQLVIYPICDLKKLGLGAKAYVELIEQVTLQWLAELDVGAVSGAHEPGVFVEGQKLVALGFHISHGKTSHGLAVNVFNDVHDFQMIRTCGVQNQQVTNLQALGVNIAKKGGLEGLFGDWFNQFRRCVVDVLREKP